MGIALLRDILGDWSSYELDDSIYVPAGSVPTLDLEVSVLPFDPLRKRSCYGRDYWLGIEQLRDVVVGIQSQMKRQLQLEERLKAVAHYAKHDAFIDPRDL